MQFATILPEEIAAAARRIFVQPVCAYIEIKGATPIESYNTARATVALLQRRDLLQRVIISSFGPGCLQAIKTWEPLLATALDPTPQDGSLTPWRLCQQVLRCGANFMLYRYQTLTAKLVDKTRQHGFDLWTWTVDDPVAMRRTNALEPAGIMTNYPDVLAQVLNEGAG